MDFEELYRKVLEARAGGVYTLRGDALQSPELALLLDRVSGGELRVKMEADPGREGERAIVEGPVDGAVLGLAGLRARAELFLVEGTPQALISFPAAARTASLAELFPSLVDEAAGPFAVAAPALRLRTVPGPDAERLRQLAAWQEERPLSWDPERDGAELARHLEVEGEVGLPAGWEWVRDLLPPAARSARATLELHPGGPRTWLTLEWPDAVRLGHLSASFSLDVVTLLDAVERDGTRTVYPRTLFRLGATVAYDDARIPSYAWFLAGGGEEIEFETLTAPGVRGAIDAFEELLGGVVPTDFIPRDRFPALDRVVLQRLRWSLGMKSLRPRFLQADFGLDAGETLVLIPDLLEATALGVSVSVYGLDTGSVAPALYASGRFAVPGSPLHGEIEGYLSLPDLGFGVGLTRGSYLDLTELLHRILPLPLELPTVLCTGLRLDGSAQDRRVAFYAEIEAPEGLPLLFLRLQGVWLSFAYAGGAVQEASLRLGGRFTVGEGTEIEVEAEYYRQGETRGWRFSGSLEADPEHPLRLTDLLPESLRPDPELFAFEVKRVAVSADTGRGSLVLELQTSDAHLDFGAAGNARLRGVTVSVEKGVKGYDWSVRTSGRIELAELEREDGTVAPLLAIDGELVQSGGKTAGIWFESATADSGVRDVWLPIPVGYRGTSDELEWSSFDLRVARIALTREASAGAEGGKWKFEADTTLTFPRLPRFVAGFLPEKGLHVVLTIDGAGADVTVKETVLDRTLPNVRLPDPYGGPGMDLGQSRLSVGNLSLRLRRRFGVEVEVRYYLPQKLNEVFGRTDDGQPRLGTLFATFDPDRRDECRYLGFKLRGGVSEDGPFVGITPSGIPLHLLDEDGGWWVLNLGPKEADGMGRYGCIRVQKGDFDLQPAKGRFRTTGRVEVAKDPALPLELLKEFLRWNRQPELANALPDLVRIPVREPPDFWSAQGTLDPGKVAEFLGLDLGRHPKLDEALRRAADAYGRLPQDFRDYLAPPTLRSLAWHFELRMDGGMEVGLEVDPPLRVLMLGGASPVVTGVTLRRLAFGPMFGGQLFKLRLDADFDMFDLVTLGAAALVPESWYPGFGDPREFRRRVVMHDLLVLIFMQLRVPIPVPLFFDPVGVQFYVPGNATLRLQAAFPEPEFNLAKLGEVVGDLVKFVRQPDFALDTDKTLTPFDLQLTLGPAFFTGGRRGREITLGRTEPLPLPSAYQLMARVLNAVKFFDVDATVKTVPVEYRFAQVTDAEVVSCLRVSGTWLLCTPAEFTAGLYARMGIDEKRMRLLMELLPRPFGEGDKGVVSFIDGRCTMAAATMSAGAAFAAVSGKQLGMAVRIQGQVAGLLDVDARAMLLIAPPEAPFQMKGRTVLSVLGLPLFDGDGRAEATSDGFVVEGRFQLLPENSILWVGTPRPLQGRLRREDLFIDGAVEARVLIFTAAGEVTVSDREVGWRLDFPGGRSGFRLGQEGSAVTVRGDVPLGWLQFKVECWLYPAELMIRQRLTSSAVQDLLTTVLDFAVPFGSGLEGVRGSYQLRVLPAVNPDPIVDGSAVLGTSSLAIGGRFKLFPDWWPFNVTGSVGGSFQPAGFRLTGEASINLVILSLKFGVVISQAEFTLTASDLIYDYSGTVRIVNGGLLIWGQAWNRWGRWSFYIDNQFPFFHWGVPQGMRMLAAVPVTEPERSWPQRLVRLALLAAWRRHHAQPGADPVLLPDEEEVSARFDWHLGAVDPAGARITLHAAQRPGVPALLEEVAARMPYGPTAAPSEAAITVEVPLRGEDLPRLHLVVSGGEDRPLRHACATLHPFAADDAYDQLASALSG